MLPTIRGTSRTPTSPDRSTADGNLRATPSRAPDANPAPRATPPQLVALVPRQRPQPPGQDPAPLPAPAEDLPRNRLTALAINIERGPRTSPPANLAANPTHQAAPAPRADRPRLPSAANGHPFATPLQLPSYNPVEGASALLANRLPLSPDAGSHPLAARQRLTSENPRREAGSRQLEALLQQQAPLSSAQILQDWATECRLPPETIDAWRPLLSQEDSRPFADLLQRLNGCASFRPQHRAGSVQELGSILELAAHNDAYRALCFNVCGGADANCHDNVDVIFGNLRLAARDPSYHGNAELHEVLNYHNRCVPWTLIDDFVSHRFTQGDLLEKVLALRMRLSDILPIPTPAMLHGPVAGIDDTHEREARHYISARLGTPENLLRSLSRSPAWRPFLE